MTKEVRIYGGEKIVYSINGACKSGQLVQQKWIWFELYLYLEVPRVKYLWKLGHKVYRWGIFEVCH